MTPMDPDRSRLILVKHAMPAIEPALTASLWALSEQGRADAMRLAEELLPHAPSRMLSSVEPKAAETARVVAERIGVVPETRPGLHEHDRRNVGFLGEDAFHAAVADFFRRPSELVMGLETADEAAARFESAVDGLMLEPPAGATVVVAHGTVISLYLARKVGLEPYGLWRRLGLPSYAVLSWPDLELLSLVERLSEPAA